MNAAKHLQAIPLDSGGQAAIEDLLLSLLEEHHAGHLDGLYVIMKYKPTAPEPGLARERVSMYDVDVLWGLQSGILALMLERRD